MKKVRKGMIKVLKLVGIACGVLVALVLLLLFYFAVYPEFSELKKRCSEIELGMSRDMVLETLGELMTKSDSVIDRGNTIGVVRGIVSCQIRFDENGIVNEVTSAVDGF